MTQNFMVIIEFEYTTPYIVIANSEDNAKARANRHLEGELKDTSAWRVSITPMDVFSDGSIIMSGYKNKVYWTRKEGYVDWTRQEGYVA